MSVKYDNGRDWVEVGGVADRPMRELLALDADTLTEAHAYAVGKTSDAHFVDHDGNVIDWRNDVLGLSVQQWNWWKSRIWAAARDERLDPEV